MPAGAIPAASVMDVSFPSWPTENTPHAVSARGIDETARGFCRYARGLPAQIGAGNLGHMTSTHVVDRKDAQRLISTEHIQKGFIRIYCNGQRFRPKWEGRPVVKGQDHCAFCLVQFRRVPEVLINRDRVVPLVRHEKKTS